MELKDINRLLDEYGFSTLTPHSTCLNSTVFFTIAQREIAQQETIEQLEALIQSRIKVALKSKRLFAND
jgi:hypothetical protein